MVKTLSAISKYSSIQKTNVLSHNGSQDRHLEDTIFPNHSKWVVDNQYLKSSKLKIVIVCCNDIYLHLAYKQMYQIQLKD